MGATGGTEQPTAFMSSQTIINPTRLVYTGGENWHVRLGQTTSPVSVDDLSPFSIITRSEDAKPVSDGSSIFLERVSSNNFPAFIHNSFDEGYEVGLMYQPSETTYPTTQRSLGLIHNIKSQSLRKKNLVNFNLYSINGKKLGKVERLKLLGTDLHKCDEDSTGSPAGVDCFPSSIGQDDRTLEEKLKTARQNTNESSSVDQTYIDSESLYSVDLLRIPYDDSSLVESVELETLSDRNDSPPPSRWSSFQCFDVFDLADRIDDCCMVDDAHTLEISNSFDDSDEIVSAKEAKYRKVLRRKLKQKRRKERMMRKIQNPETITIARDDSFSIVVRLPD
jgi:hypothetical protein